MKIENPFNDWTEDKHCKYWGTLDINRRRLLEARDPKAVKWCANSWLIYKEVPCELRDAFSRSLEHKSANFYNSIFNNSIVIMNDTLGWSCAKFKEAWDKFAESSIK